MPPAVAAAPAAGAAGAGDQRQQQTGGFQQLLQTVVRFGIMWWLMQNFNKGKAPPAAVGPDGAALAASAPLYRKGDLVDMYLYLSEGQVLDKAQASLVWTQRDIALAVSPERTATVRYAPSEAVKNNGSLFAHVVFARAGLDIDGSDDLPPDAVFTKSHSLIAYIAPLQNKTGVNLLSEGGNLTAKLPPEQRKTPVAHLKPNVTVAHVDHFTTYPRNAVPPPLAPFVDLNGDAQQYPIVVFEDFWLLRDKLLPLNASLSGEVELHLHVKPLSFWWMQMQQQFEQSFKMQITAGLAQDGEADEVKRIFLEGNPYLLALTMAVSMLHTVFDVLAFKNDIGFWKENRSMEGLSARSVVANAVCQLIILLYLFDNETSMVVLFSAAVGTAIEFWKVTKAMDVSLGPRFPFLFIRDKASYADNPTKQHDATAMRYLSYALYPCVIGRSIYALYYETHRSWYSWAVASLVGAVYAFGFILMCPQLYLNYKLKSVAHLPWRQMTYKFLNTIIDDLFAFVIKMPTLHRLSVFRDDLVFLVYLYQRWIYRVDPTRVNEFGWSAADAAAAAERPAAAAAAALPAAGGKAEEEEEEEEEREGEEGQAGSSGAARQRRKRAANGSAAAAAGDEAEPAAADSKKGK